MKEVVSKPYWYVDLKWFFGILFTLALTLTLSLSLANRLTEEKTAVDLSTVALATLFSRDGGGLDDPKAVEEFKAKLKESDEELIRPIETIPAITISRDDVEKLSPRELRLKIFRQITEPLYNEGVDGAVKRFTDNPEEQKKLANDASLLRFLTKDTHEKISSFLTIGIAVTVLFLIGLVFFSFGWGRLGNPGLILFVLGLPGAAFGLLISNPPSNGDGGGLSSLPPEFGVAIAQQLKSVFGLVSLGGLTLLVVALVGSIISRRRRRIAKNSA
ncbi:MAG: hypothetical protein HZB70_02605 [Candidatus Berkelbacteria bacterium]|nr:MAG: hypothetical protein HZB70_02605 [Candidatus Berkelbacteria bacterium]QQG51803.1 MAG: hypothetical protein HY845_00390 [Candidatus Berkelbacteria bacterium]